MKRSNSIFENIIVILSVLGGLLLLIDGDNSFVLVASWWFVFGVLQLLHSLILGVAYWKQPAIRTAIVFYWAGVVINFIVMYINDETVNNFQVEMATVVVFPALLALGLWFICLSFKRPKMEVAPVLIRPKE